MKKNLFFVALIFLLAGAGCEAVDNQKDGNNENLEKTVMEQNLPKVEDVNNTENMEVEDSVKEVKSVENKIVVSDKESSEKMEREDDEDEHENESEDDDSKKVTTKTDSQTTTPAPTTPTATTPTTSTVKSYTMAEVKAGNSAQKCWTAVSGKVYDLTSALVLHPGGKAAMMKLCGIDGTSAFNNQHGGQSNPMSMLNGLQIGVLK
ncbi:MAG: hypothetical protein COX80_00875 [Candidatus Magasanikbacteria bacterium CG_4_10_14_0_2_um_filter_33_14]|uniref:Cytochrome b5 heme-binding domain-containing protein n=1 Tax=Candidatus Magasanikbacteria bacterium CG_4_10_14_0_2_um_filter_33_14 TaxID=1974636 RepID=A0A2M7VBS2_9BACT|nr:MAG: hypothetical protein COX80_00875 [Candidatus Magasanikbacteria bacterium CG_4_10_14_0_2_um_filter_33_14]